MGLICRAFWNRALPTYTMFMNNKEENSQIQLSLWFFSFLFQLKDREVPTLSKSPCTGRGCDKRICNHLPTVCGFPYQLLQQLKEGHSDLIILVYKS